MANSFYTIPNNENIIQPKSYDAPRQPEAFSATFVERGSYAIAQTPAQRALRAQQRQQAPADRARNELDAVYASQAPVSTEAKLSLQESIAYVNYVGQIGQILERFIAKETGSLN